MVGWNHEGSIRKGQKCCKKELWQLCHNLPPGIRQHNTDKALYGTSTNQNLKGREERSCHIEQKHVAIALQTPLEPKPKQ